MSEPSPAHTARLDEASPRPARLRAWAARVGFAGGGTAALGGLLLLLTGNALLGLFNGIGGGGGATLALAWGLIGAGGLLAGSGFALLGLALWSQQAGARGSDRVGSP